MRLRHALLPILLSAALPAGAAMAHDQQGAKFPQDKMCLGLPAAKVAIQSYTFMGELLGITLPPELYDKPPFAKFVALQSKFGNQKPSPPAPEKIAAMLKTLRDIGYRNVEGFGLIEGPAPDVYAKLLKEAGLSPVASHYDLDPAVWSAILARAKANGQRFVGSGGFGKPGLDTLEHVLETARNLDALGKAATDQGLTFYVHNHTEEFTRSFPFDRGDGKPVMTSAWEIVAAKTDPRYVHFEVDVFWAQTAFKPEKFDELLAFMTKYRDRIVLLHMKDYAANGAVADLGRGTIDWRRVVKAAGPQIGYYIYEYDLPPNPAESARIGFDYLTCGGRG